MTQAFNFDTQEGITEDGLSLKSYDDLLTYAQDGLTSIYAVDGNSINFDSETADGQVTNIIAQLGTDVRELATGVYNSFDPDKTPVQDDRYALNYIYRKGGTFTIQNIDVTVNQTVTLPGLDGRYDDLTAAGYTVSDDSGNLWYLIDTVTLTTGTTSLPFRSKDYGVFQPTIGTITNQVTKILGVTNVTNSTPPTTLGGQQESNLQFRLRRERSTAVRGQNNNDAMLGQILELNTVTDATLFVNIPGNDDYDSNLPDNSIWVIVEGGASNDIAEVIYQNSTGLPLYATSTSKVQVNMPSVSGQIFNAKFNRANPVNLYIRFDFKLFVDLSAVNIDGIKEYIAENLTYKLSEDAETSKVTNVASNGILAKGGGGYALNVEISTDGTNYTDFIASSSIQNKFVIDKTNITITPIEQSST